ncbi:MAG TPA: cytochrome c-type biogenesis protein CcmH [Thermoanaerobaculia bacterium]
MTTRHAARGTRHLLILVALFVVATTVAAQTPATSTQVPDASQFVGSPQGQPLSGEVLDRETDRVGGLLRCPVCQGLAVADSPAEMAVNMKGQVRELLSRGYTEEQILRYFEQSYGQFVLLQPKFEGLNALVWLLPLIALIIGAAIVFVKLKKLAAEPPPESRPADDPYLAQVRDLVGGGKS